MKINRWFIISIVLFLCLMFALESNMPKRFTWNPTFGHYDRQPFGCSVFDDVIEKSLPPDSYTLSDETFYQLSQAEDDVPKGILSVTKNLSLSETDVESVFELAERGNVILLVSNSFGTELEDSLRFTTSYSYFSASELKRYATSLNKRDSLLWLEDSVYKERIFQCYPQLCEVEIEPKDSCLLVPLVDKWKAVIKDGILLNDSPPMVNTRVPVAMSYAVGEGEIIFVSTPLLFTNYGMLDNGNADYLFRYLNRMKGLSVVRTEAYTKLPGKGDSPFRYFLSQRSLRWGLYLTLLTLVLFMIFTARRRQRVIPVVREPENKNLEFTELIGTLYYQKKNHADLVSKKFVYFAENLRRNYQIDVEDDSNDEALARQIALKTGGEELKILELLRLLRPVMRGEVKVNDRWMCELIDGMNETSPPNPLR